MNLALPILVALLLTAMVGAVLVYFTRTTRARERLQVQTQEEQGLVQMEKEKTILPEAVVKGMEAKLGLAKDSEKAKELKKTLVQAGYVSDRAVSILLGLKIGLAVALPLIAWPVVHFKVSNWLLYWGILYLSVVLGYFLPTIVLSQMVADRQKKIRETLPDTLDLMVVCVEAGQGLNAAMKKVSEEMRKAAPILSMEIQKVNLEINAGMKRDQALQNLGERTGVEEVISLCNILIQSERFGTSIAKALKVQSDTLRTNRRQKLEELAAKTPVKLIFPLLMFIFPAIMVVIMGPAIIRISETLLK
jgi:tight adherence protein C